MRTVITIKSTTTLPHYRVRGAENRVKTRSKIVNDRETFGDRADTRTSETSETVETVVTVATVATVVTDQQQACPTTSAVCTRQREDETLRKGSQ